MAGIIDLIIKFFFDINLILISIQQYLVIGFVFITIICAIIFLYKGILKSIQFGSVGSPYSAYSKEEKKNVLINISKLFALLLVFTFANNTISSLTFSEIEDFQDSLAVAQTDLFDCGFSLQSIATMCGFRESLATGGALSFNLSYNVYSGLLFGVLEILKAIYVTASLLITGYFCGYFITYLMNTFRYLSGDNQDVNTKSRLRFQEQYLVYLYFLPAIIGFVLSSLFIGLNVSDFEQVLVFQGLEGFLGLIASIVMALACVFMLIFGLTYSRDILKFVYQMLNESSWTQKFKYVIESWKIILNLLLALLPFILGSAGGDTVITILLLFSVGCIIQVIVAIRLIKGIFLSVAM